MDVRDLRYGFAGIVAGVRVQQLPAASFQALSYLLSAFAIADEEQTAAPRIVEVEPLDSGWRLRSLGQPREHASDATTLLPGVARRVHRFIRQHSTTHVFVHASAVSVDGRALVLLGEPGSGKSSLTLELCQRGRAYLGDDLLAVLVDAPLVVPYLRPLCMKEDTVPRFVEAAREGVSIPGEAIWYWRPPVIAASSVPVGWVVECRRAGGNSAVLEPLSTPAADALYRALWASPQVSTERRQEVTRLACQGTRHLVLRYGDHDRAIGLLENLP